MSQPPRSHCHVFNECSFSSSRVADHRYIPARCDAYDNHVHTAMNNLPSTVRFVVLGQSDQVKASPEPVLSHSCSIRFSDADIEFFRSTDPRTIRDPPCRGLGHCGSLSRDPQNSFLARDSVSADRISYTETRPFDRDIHNSQHEPADHRANSKFSSEVGSDLTGSLGPRETCGISPGSDPGVKYTKGVPCHDNIFWH